MDFDTLRSQIGKYQTDENASVIGVQMRSLIADNGLDIFKDIDLLSNEIKKLSLSSTVKSQLILIFTSSTISDYVLNSKSDLNMVDIDNVVHSVIDSTGLSYNTAIPLIVDIFYACGLNFAVEYMPRLFEDSIEYQLHAVMPTAVAEEKIKRAYELYDNYQVQSEQSDVDNNQITDQAEEVIEAINELCSYGISDGFYLLAECYLYGKFNTDVDFDKAFILMKISAARGNTKAAASLGDFYYGAEKFWNRDYTVAQYYYTRPGSNPIKSKQQIALQDIYKQGRENKTTLLFSVIIIFLTIAFVVFFHEGIFSGSNRIIWGIIALSLSLATVVLTIIYHIRKKFNGIRWVIAIQFFIWAMYVLILDLS